MNNNTHPTWQDLLISATKNPGKMLEAYRAFHGYSLGNQLLAESQCDTRGIAIGPIATFEGWKAKHGRHVKKGERAITLCMPITFKGKKENEDGEVEDVTRKVFTYKANWFVLSQTDGQDYELPPMPTWDKAKALAALGITETVFAMADGNTQGYAKEQSIAINPTAQLPAKTMFHELAHVVLGHTKKGEAADGADLPKSLVEAEAEAVAMLLCEALELPGADYCRGYIQNWLRGRHYPESSAQRIFSAADKILKAGC